MTIAIKEIDKSILDKFSSDPASLKTLCVLPNNYDNAASPSEYHFAESLLTVKKLFRKGNLPIQVLGDREDKKKYYQARGVEWICPTILVPMLCLTNNPSAVSIALSMIANYLTDIFPFRNDVSIETNIVLCDKDSVQQISYKGPIEGLKEIKRTVNQLKKK